MSNPIPIDFTREAVHLLHRAGYETRLVAEDGRPVIYVKDPVHRVQHGSTMLALAGYEERRVYGTRFDSILRCALRFVEERS